MINDVVKRIDLLARVIERYSDDHSELQIRGDAIRLREAIDSIRKKLPQDVQDDDVQA